MPAAHRNGDLRACGAITVVTWQNTVFVNGKLWAVLGDKDSHCNEGNLRPVVPSAIVRVGGRRVAVIGSPALPDNSCNIPTHNNTDASTGSGNVNAY